MTIKDINPVTTGHDLREDQPLMRRLFEVDYTCPLCGQNHMAETYVQSETSNLDDLNAEAIRCMSDARTAVPLLQNHMRFVHTEQGNFTELLEHLKGSTQEADLVINTVTMTHEENLSCDQCAHQFDSTLELAVHMGVNPTNGTRFAPAACDLSRASTKHTSGAEQKCTTREVIGQRKCPRQLFGRGVTEAGWQQAGRVSE